MKSIENLLIAFGNNSGTPLLIVILSGGLFFLFYSNFLPFRYIKHSFDLIRGKFDDPNATGDINHYQALSSSIAATVGMGNISGVAVAISTGGPGALFWMWVSAFLGIATKFFTCSLAIMYRGKESNGHITGGPMYVITEGLGKKWKPLAIVFCIACMFGALPVFQANQLTQAIRDILLVPNGIMVDSFIGSVRTSDLITGIVIVILVSLVIFGGIKRIGLVAGKMIPSMIVIYMVSVALILITNYDRIIDMFILIFSDAFTGNAVLGGSIGAIIVKGAQRAAFSNEAGVGTAPMIHGASKTNEPIREGLVAMLGPAIDTLLICTLTALAILLTNTWQSGEASGVTITSNAFNAALPGIGSYLLLICVLIFSITSLFSYSYYGSKCLSFLIGEKYKNYYNYFYVATIIVGAVISIDAVIGLIDGMYAVMAFPTTISALILAPKVKEEAKKYFARISN